MGHKIPGSKAVLLSTDRVGDEDKVRAILAAWGMEEAAIRRMMIEDQRDGRGLGGSAASPARNPGRAFVDGTENRNAGRGH